jgi:hypothetical protein
MPDSPQSRGGHARAAKLSPARRSAIARKAARGRWGQPRLAPEPEFKRVTIHLDSAMDRALEHLAAEGLLGCDADEVATYLLLRALDDLWRAGVLKLGAKS